MARPKGSPKLGGRKKGTPNKIPSCLRTMILEALERRGGANYLYEQAAANPGPFMTLVGKVLPKEIHAAVEGGIVIRLVDDFKVAKVEDSGSPD